MVRCSPAFSGSRSPSQQHVSVHQAAVPGGMVHAGDRGWQMSVRARRTGRGTALVRSAFRPGARVDKHGAAPGRSRAGSGGTARDVAVDQGDGAASSSEHATAAERVVEPKSARVGRRRPTSARVRPPAGLRSRIRPPADFRPPARRAISFRARSRPDPGPSEQALSAPARVPQSLTGAHRRRPRTGHGRRADFHSCTA